MAPGRPCRTPLRVVVIDDDDINRLGMATLLDSAAEITVVASQTHDGALTCDDLWSSVDVAIVDAADRRRSGDQFPGVAVVEHIRRHRPSGLTVIVITGHYFDSAVRRRMREARADFFYHRAEVAEARTLHNAVLRPEEALRVPEPHDPEAQFRHGVTDGTHVNRAVDYALEQRLEEQLKERAEPRSRRWQRLRGAFYRVAGLTPITSDGRQPDRRQDQPSLPQIARFLSWATKVKDTPPDNDD